MFCLKKEKPFLKYFSVDIASHCNLNCKYCDHFSPLSDEIYADLNDLKKHFRRISGLLNVGMIGLMGGEPLLHPDIADVLKITRRIFKNSIITLRTNGILLEKQPDKFWQICSRYNIYVVITKYPIKLNYKIIYQKAQEYGVSVSYIFDRESGCKKMYKFIFDMNGKQDAGEMAEICWQNKGNCTYFNNGCFYPCSIAGNVNKFNKFFNQNLIVSSDDYIDIYKIKRGGGKKIINFINTAIPFCRYCDIKAQIPDLNFEISKKEITEWT